MKRSVVLKSVAFVISALLVFLVVIKFKYGTGKNYPDLGANLPTESFVLEKLIQLATRPETSPLRRMAMSISTTIRTQKQIVFRRQPSLSGPTAKRSLSPRSRHRRTFKARLE